MFAAIRSAAASRVSARVRCVYTLSYNAHLSHVLGFLNNLRTLGGPRQVGPDWAVGQRPRSKEDKDRQGICCVRGHSIMLVCEYGLTWMLVDTP